MHKQALKQQIEEAAMMLANMHPDDRDYWLEMGRSRCRHFVKHAPAITLVANGSPQGGASGALAARSSRLALVLPGFDADNCAR